MFNKTVMILGLYYSTRSVRISLIFLMSKVCLTWTGEERERRLAGQAC